MWPTRPDMSRDECRKFLRCLELDAYGNMVSVLRAQGAFTDEKQKLLCELGKVLHISNERHRAEVRRAVNDEKLSVIAEQLNGPNTCTDWAIEGRRTIPLLPRLKAHTAFTGLANSLSLVIAAANEKKLAVTPNKIEESIVKTEAECRVDTDPEEKSVPILPVFHSEINARGKKRKRSLRESPENEKVKTQAAEENRRDSEMNSTPCKERRVDRTLTIPSNQSSNVVQVSIVTPSSTADITRHNDNVVQGTATQLTCSTANILPHRKVTIVPSTTTSSAESNSVVSQNSTNTHTVTTIPTKRVDIPSVPTTYPGSAKSRETITAIQNKSNPKIQQTVTAQSTSEKSLQLEERELHRKIDRPAAKLSVMKDDGPKISRPDSTTSNTPVPKRITATKICVTTKPVITSSTSRLVTVNSGSTASSGPGPPTVKTTTTLTYKKLPPGSKLNHNAAAKMGIALNSNKTLKINAHPNARLAAKANVIVVQKGSSRGVTLSHGGKEVRGKVIMGGKNLCLASQQNATSVALLPHRAVSNNGDQTLAMLSTMNASHADSLKTGGKTGNMIVFDIRQDVLEKNKVLSQFLEASGVFNPDSKTAILNSNSTRLPIKIHSGDTSNPVASKITKPAIVVNNSTVDSKAKSKTINEPADSSNATCETENRQILTDSEERIEVHGVLDAQTGIYNYESTDGTIIETQEESIATTGLDIFSTALASANINLESFRYVDEEEEDEEVVRTAGEEIVAGSPMSTVEQLNELSDS